MIYQVEVIPVVHPHACALPEKELDSVRPPILHGGHQRRLTIVTASLVDIRSGLNEKTQGG
eukprot:CAMPEP_0182516234 /NCGR_PEP_ID=MMETSP1321-20130603/39820_1 /TAXON_ID=91990 /ORGANISM="Bolidomonas sp., Strain RCC1657" /LENGTH=60 /DNA_ID=CAMNT_0024723775 /DNA_START=429 /DNA_END=611 /DNA_ORIENTATION=+